MKRADLRFTVLPLLVLISSFAYSDFKGPHWRNGESDPEYAYLLNSLNIVEFSAPAMVEHPGTTVELLGAALIRVKHTVFSDYLGSASKDVIRSPEQFLQFMRGFLILLNVALLFFVGSRCFRSTRNVGYALALQTAPFISTAAFSSFTRFSPEPLLFAASQCVILLSISYIFSTSVSSRRLFLFFELLLGMALATKVTFLPLCSLLLLLPGTREKLRGLAVTIGTFVACLIPAFPNLGRAWGFWKGVALHRGTYGEGAPGIPTFHVWLQNLVELAREDIVFVPVILFSLVTIFIVRNRGKLETNEVRKAQSVFQVLFLAYIVQVILAAKSTGARYLLPSTALSEFVFFLNFYLLPRRFQGVICSLLWVGVTCALIGITFQFTKNDMMGIRKVIEESNAADVIIKTKFSQCTLVDYYNSPSQVYALSFGNSWVNQKYSVSLKEEYSGKIFYNIWGKYFYDFADTHLDESNLRGKECIVIRGNPFTGSRIRYLPLFKIEPIYQGDLIAMYQVKF